ncbi:hypothetical protein [Streptomyces sp. NPDC008150]|uniref:hypothetical protein n=1 Tax=Streptomyces sp. NPDC008150 TaxID=3364816 RepID=UPI0036E95FF0
MKALSGIERAWSGARATVCEPSPAHRAHRHLAIGGRIGEVVPRRASDTDGTSVDRRADDHDRDGAATGAP